MTVWVDVVVVRGRVGCTEDIAGEGVLVDNPAEQAVSIVMLHNAINIKINRCQLVIICSGVLSFCTCQYFTNVRKMAKMILFYGRNF